MQSLERSFRIDKGSPAGVLYLGICIHNYCYCDGVPYIHIMKAYIFLCLVIL